MTKEKILKAKWGSPDKPLIIGNRSIQCYVLEDGTRVLSGRGTQEAVGLGQSHGTLLKSFFNQKNLKPYINNELAMELKSPLRFIRPGRGGKPALAYEATILPELCDSILEARDKLGNKLTKKQKEIAYQCELLVRVLSKIGIIALVDEVTGYQYDRTRHALEEILDKFISKELRKWAKTFPDEFYEHMFKLRGWQYIPFSVKRPGVVGKYTNDLVYERLAPGVLKELKRITPRNSKGRTKHRLFQRLTEDVGHPRLREHLTAVIALMKASTSWGQFYRMIQRALPKHGDQLLLPIEDFDDN